MIVERLKMGKILQEARKTKLDTTSKDYTKKIKTFSSEAEKMTPSKATAEAVSDDIEIIEITGDSSNQPGESLNESCQIGAVVQSLSGNNKLKRKISELPVVETATLEKEINTNKKINKICLSSKKALNSENNTTQTNKTLPLMSSLSSLNNLAAFNLLTNQANQQQSSFLINNNDLGQIKIPLQPQLKQQQQPAFIIPSGFQGTILFQPTIHVHTNNKSFNLTNYRKIIPKNK